MTYRIALTFVLLFTFPIIKAQETAEELALAIFKAFQTGQIDQIEQFVPDKKQTWKLTKEMKLLESKKEFNEKYQAQHDTLYGQYMRNCWKIAESGSEAFHWQETNYSGYSLYNFDLMLDEEKNEKYPMQNLNVYFTDGEKEYRLLVNEIYKANGTWFIGGRNMGLILSGRLSLDIVIRDEDEQPIPSCKIYVFKKGYPAKELQTSEEGGFQYKYESWEAREVTLLFVSDDHEPLFRQIKEMENEEFIILKKSELHSSDSKDIHPVVEEFIRKWNKKYK